MTQRLTQEQEAALRKAVARCEAPHYLDARALLSELDALRAELVEAEQRGREAEFAALRDAMHAFTGACVAVGSMNMGTAERLLYVFGPGPTWDPRSPGTPPPGAAKDRE